MLVSMVKRARLEQAPNPASETLDFGAEGSSRLDTRFTIEAHLATNDAGTSRKKFTAIP